MSLRSKNTLFSGRSIINFMLLILCHLIKSSLYANA